MNFKDILIKTDNNLSLNAKYISKKSSVSKGILIYFHGGGLIFGTHDDLQDEYLDVLTDTFDVLLVSYRLIPESSLSDIFNDVKHIYNYATSLSKDIYVFGRSAGGYLSYLMSKHFDVKGAVIFYGYYHFNHQDFKQLPKDQTKYSQLLSPSIEKMNVRNEVTTYEPPNPRFLLYLYYRHNNLWKDKLQVDLNDSKYYLTDEDLKNMPKTLLVHCNEDPDVPYDYSQHASRLIKDSKLITLNSNEHDFDREVTHKSLDIYKQISEFFK